MGFKSTKGVTVNSLIEVKRSSKTALGRNIIVPETPVDIATPTITYPAPGGTTGKTFEISSYSGAKNYGITNIILTYDNGTNFDNENTFITAFDENEWDPPFFYVPGMPSNNDDVTARVQYLNAQGESVIGPPIQFESSTDIFAGSKGGTEYSFVTQLDGPYGVLNAFDGSTSTYFGPTSAGRNPATTMIWNFSSGYPLSSGDTFTTRGYAGGGFQATITLANGQTSNIGQTITVSSNTRISKFQCGLWGNADQYSRISGFEVNGVMATHKTWIT